MSHALSLRPRAVREIDAARAEHGRVGHGASFLADLERAIDAIQEMPRRFPVVHGVVHRALLKRYPFAVFFRVRASEQVIVLAVLPQRSDPARRPPG